MARTAFEDAIAELDSVTEDSYKDHDPYAPQAKRMRYQYELFGLEDSVTASVCPKDKLGFSKDQPPSSVVVSGANLASASPPGTTQTPYNLEMPKVTVDFEGPTPN